MAVKIMPERRPGFLATANIPPEDAMQMLPGRAATNPKYKHGGLPARHDGRRAPVTFAGQPGDFCGVF